MPGATNRAFDVEVDFPIMCSKTPATVKMKESIGHV
jgi:hypothetical protein